MNKPRFKVGDKVYSPEYWGNVKLTIRKVHYADTPFSNIDEVDGCPYFYTFEQEDYFSPYKDGGWDYQCVAAEIYESPLYQALKEEK